MKKPKNLQELADLIRNVPTRSNSKMSFDMNLPFDGACNTEHPCGSACCIGGWVQYLHPETRGMSLEEAVETLTDGSIQSRELESLCWPDNDPTDPEGDGYHATPEQGARAIEILIETGKCNWAEALSEGENNV